jgi:hypothetical protein
MPKTARRHSAHVRRVDRIDRDRAIARIQAEIARDMRLQIRNDTAPIAASGWRRSASRDR